MRLIVESSFNQEREEVEVLNSSGVVACFHQGRSIESVTVRWPEDSGEPTWMTWTRIPNEPRTDAVDAYLTRLFNFVEAPWVIDDLRPLWQPTNTDAAPITESMLRRASGLDDDTRD